MSSDGEERARRYGEALAGVYDLMYPWAEGAEIAARLRELVGDGGRALELGVGSGRVAIPLAASGVAVHGIDASPSMLDRLNARDPAGSVTSSVGDFATTTVARHGFDLVYIVCNTLFMLDGDGHLDTLRRAREQVAPDGRLVIEAYDPRRFHALDGPLVQTRHLAPDILMIDTVNVDPVHQLLIVVHTLLRSGRVETFVETSAYRWPSELDLLTATAGFEREARWGDWHGGEYTSASDRHISVYRPRHDV